ncbi:MAG: helix-turn-helix domain-containing protein [Pseudomonadota bacterium]
MIQPTVAGVPIRKNCPLDRLFRLLAGEWTPHVIWVLGTAGPTRFNDLQRLVEGISPKVLTERLRLLEAAGIVERHAEAAVPPKVTYSLSDKGGSLHKAIKGMEATASALFDEEQDR